MLEHAVLLPPALHGARPRVQAILVVHHTWDGRRASLPIAGPVVIDRVSATDRVFNIDTGQIRLQVIGSDGTNPAVGVSLELRTEDGRWRQSVETDSIGRARITDVPAGKVFVAAFHATMSTPEARREQVRRTGVLPEPMELLTIEVKGQGSVNPADVVMPGSSGY